MPIASSGNVISSSNQLGADVVLTAAIKDGEIVNADLSATAAIAATKIQTLSVGVNGGVLPSTGIADTHLSATAAIADGKLAQITTASKVHGSSLTGLASIPAGAGVIPVANVPGKDWKNGTTTRDSATSGAQNIAHGLGRTPIRVRIHAFKLSGVNNSLIHSDGVYNGSTQACNYITFASGSAAIAQSTTVIIRGVSSGNFPGEATCSVDGTNITLTWTANANFTGTWYIMWEAQ